MERRVLIALFLSFLVLYGYQQLYPSKPPAKPETVATQAVATGQGAKANADAKPAQVPETASAAALVGDTSVKDIRIETPHVTAVFTNRGARLKSWALKDYRDHNGDPLELVDASFGDAQPLPFSLSVPDAALTSTLNTALFAVTQTRDASNERITFEYRTDAGLRDRKSVV